jgi:SAM-dependent methyltransferase
MAARTLAYGDDLAYIHNVGYDFHSRGLAPHLLGLLQRAGLEGTTVVDLGCGGGIWAQKLGDAGFHAVGVDISPAMIALARQRAPQAKFHVASFLDFDLPASGAITALGEVLCFQFDRGANRRALARLFRRAHAALVPGGLFIFDIAEVGLDRARQPTWQAADDWACLVRFQYDERRNQLVRQITSFRQVGQLYRRGDETHRIQLYERREIASLLRKAGFQVRTTRQFGEYQLLPKRVAFVARKGK